MHKRFYYLFFIVLIFLFLNWMNVFADDINYKVSDYTINAYVQNDGGVDISEYITYDFKDKANGVYRDIEISNPENQLYSAATIKNIVISEAVGNEDETIPYIQGNGKNGMAGFYSISKISNGIRIKIHFPAKKEIKRFIIQYHLDGTVVRYRDTADFYWRFISPGWNKDLDNVHITVTIPKASKELRIFSHGPINGGNIIVDTTDVEYDNVKIRQGKSVSLRVLFPSNLVSNDKKYINESKLNEILKQESSLTKEANNQRIISAFANFLPTLCILILLILYFKYRRGKKFF